jgi:hypothetical protein
MGRSFDLNLAAIRSVARFDADESGVLARELESIERVVTLQAYPELKSLDLVPLIPGVDPGAETYTWRHADGVGKAKVIANMSEDIPSVDISIDENYVPVRTIATQYHFTVQELRAFLLAKAKGSNIQLDTARAEQARRLIARLVDEIVAIGVAAVPNLTGFLNNGNVSITAAAGVWAGMTPQQILADIQKLERKVITQSMEVFSADVLVVPINQYALLSQPLGVNNDHSIKDFILENALSIKSIIPWNRLTNAAAGGATDRAVAYKRDVTVAGAIVPLMFEAQPPQAHGLRFDVACEARCGGTVVRQPLGMAYMDGV